MKHLLLVLFIFTSFTCLSQTINGIYIEKRDSNQVKIENILNDMNYQIAGTKYCIGKFTKQSYTAFVISGVGAAILASTSFDDLSVKERQYLTYGGGIIMLVGIICQIDAFKWLTRASLSPAEYGIGVKAIF